MRVPQPSSSPDIEAPPSRCSKIRTNIDPHIRPRRAARERPIIRQRTFTRTGAFTTQQRRTRAIRRRDLEALDLEGIAVLGAERISNIRPVDRVVEM